MDSRLTLPSSSCPIFRSSLVGAMLLSLMGGCGEPGPKLVPVSGVVTLDGKPLSQAGVLFQPVQGGPPGIGVTDENGRFEIKTQNRPGALLGEHRVCVAKQQPIGSHTGVAGPGPVQVRSLIPEKYLRPETSGLTVHITGHQGEIKLELRSQ